MAGLRGNGSVPSLPPPRPKSPPQYPDLYGKRREFAKVQMLEREIGFLEVEDLDHLKRPSAMKQFSFLLETTAAILEELKSIEALHPASKSCKEVVDFVMATADPLIPTTKKATKSCRFWKWLCRVSCFNFSWICCFSCTPNLELPRCCQCNCDCNCNACSSCSNPCANCRMPKCHCCTGWKCWCISKPKCCSSSNLNWCCCFCAPPDCPSCPSCSCKRCCTCFPKCPKCNISSCCHSNICCYPCYLCY